MIANNFTAASTRHGMFETLRQARSFLLVVASPEKAPRLFMDVANEEDMHAIITALALDFEEACLLERAIFNTRGVVS